MNVKRLIEGGYFPKELPPPFTSELFGQKSPAIGIKWQRLLAREAIPQTNESGRDAERRFFTNYTFKYGTSAVLNFSLAKGLHSRRQLGIPNPKQYHDLCNVLVKNWPLLRQSLKRHSFSASTPIESDEQRAFRTKSKSLNDFKFQLIERSFNKRFELRLDINQFYPSIYTHSIAWAIMGRTEAKKYFKEKNKSKQHWQALLLNDPAARRYSICEQIDTLVRNCQERQSVGLPIGPDTSFLLAELVGNRLDEEIAVSIGGIEHAGIRYFDDYYFYANSYGDLETILRSSEGIFNSFSLELNEEKVRIRQIPFTFEPKWVSILSMFRFSSGNKHEMLNFFALIFELIRDNPKESNLIIAHGLRRFEYGNIRIPYEAWETFLSLLIKTMLTDPSNLDKFLKIILSYPHQLDTKSKTRISGLLHSIVRSNMGLSHTFEVAWSMWIMRALGLKAENGFLTEVLKKGDCFSKLIALDMIDSKLFKGKKPTLTKITTGLSEGDLFNDQWLFTYESIRKGWLTPIRDILLGNEYFKILFDSGVEFYNPTNQITPEFINEPYAFAGMPF